MPDIIKFLQKLVPSQEKRFGTIIFLTVLAVLLTLFLNLAAGDFFYRTSYDMLVSEIGGREKKSDPRVALVLIDELSIEYGQGIGLANWPWSRRIYDPIINFINMDGKPKAIFFDILFTESDKRQENDEAFQLAIDQAKNIYHNVLLLKDREAKTIRPLPPDIKKFYLSRVKNVGLIGWDLLDANDYKFPFPCLRSMVPCNLTDRDKNRDKILSETMGIAGGLAVASFKPDVDGVHRHGRILFNYNNHYLPSISLAAMNALYPSSAIEVEDSRTMRIGNFRIPVNEKGEYLINFYPKRIEAVSMSAIFQSAANLEAGEEKLLVKPSFFKDKIVLIGCSAVGCQDLKSTPVSGIFPGPELHANIISNILQDNHIIQENDYLTIVLMFVVILLTTSSILFFRSPLTQLGIPFGIVIFYIGVSLALFHYQNYLGSLFNVISSFVVSGAVSFIYLSMTEGAERRKYSKILSNMVDPGIVSEALKDLDSLKKGDEKEITAFFSDVASFSTISEQLSADALAALLNEYLSAMTIILKHHGGTLDKYIGDAIVGIFNAPVNLANHPLKAAEASLEMLERIASLREYWKKKNLYTVDAQRMSFRIGLNTGRAKVGFMGTETLASYTMMGDTVNLAARLEAAAKDYGVKILVSEYFSQEVNDKMFLRKLDIVRVKGKTEPVALYELIGRLNEVPANLREAAILYEQGLNFYLQREWNTAIQSFQKSEKTRGEEDKSVAALIDRCEHYQSTPPPQNWDGVFTRTHK